MTLLIPVALLVLLMLGGVPVAFSLGLSGLAGLIMVTGDLSIALSFMGLVPIGEVTDYVLLALPLFLLMAQVASVSNIADDVYNAAAAWLSGRRGGLPLATIVAGSAIGALSGSTVAAASALSGITVRNQIRAGYSEEMAAGTAALSASLAILIPPSLLMIIYGSMTQTSVGALLIAGLLPGLTLAVMLAITVRLWIFISPTVAPAPFKSTWTDRWHSTLRVWPAVLIMSAVFVLLYTGVITPTEVAAVGALGMLMVAVAMGRMSVNGLVEASIRAVSTTSMIIFILIGGTIFARYLSLTRMPQELARSVADAGMNRWIVIALIVIGYFLMSMFMDELPLVVLTVPVTVPLITELGFDPVWFGVLTAFMVIMGLVFPPVGMLSFVVSAAAGVRSVKVFKGAIVLLCPVILTTLLVVVFPQLALWLPSLR